MCKKIASPILITNSIQLYLAFKRRVFDQPTACVRSNPTFKGKNKGWKLKGILKRLEVQNDGHIFGWQKLSLCKTKDFETEKIIMDKVNDIKNNY